MSMPIDFPPRISGLRRALASLRRPGAKLMLTFSPSRKFGRAFSILPQGDHVADERAQALIKRLMCTFATADFFLITHNRGRSKEDKPAQDV
jgi:hypothetical protein